MSGERQVRKRRRSTGPMVPRAAGCVQTTAKCVYVCAYYVLLCTRTYNCTSECAVCTCTKDSNASSGGITVLHTS